MSKDTKLVLTSRPAETEGRFKHRKILIIDDEATYRFALRRMIERRFGTTVYEADNPIQGIEIVQFRKPHLILLDMQMPYMDGKTALAEIRQLPVSKNTPVIAITAVADVNLAVQLKELGLSSYILKPFEREHVLQKIEDVLNSLDKR